MDRDLTIGFIGFGEAGFNIAKGLRGEGLDRVFAYDINTHTPRLGEKIKSRAQSSGVSLVESPEELCQACGVFFSAVTADQALKAAEQTAPYLEARHVYVDINSVSPATKRSVGEIITGAEARFVEAAVMSAVIPLGHRVPMLLGGKAAHEFTELLAPYGMNLEVISEQIGAAVAVKLCRSIVVKGLEALLLECALVASRYGADARVFASLQDKFPGVDWGELAGYMIGRVVQHGERRAREMEEVARMLSAAGIDPIMAEATGRRQEWGGRLALPEEFDGKLPDGYAELMRAITKEKER